MVVYYSAVSGNQYTKKHTTDVESLLLAKKIPFTPIDISMNPVAKEYMYSKSKHENPATLPQIFYNGQFIGVTMCVRGGGEKRKRKRERDR